MLRYLTAFCLIILMIPSSGRLEAAGPPPVERLSRVGQIFVIGNDRTSQSVILEQVRFFPGQELTTSAVRRAERNLRRLRIFKDRDGVRPTVRSLVNPNDPDNVYKDILITVVEDDTCGVVLGLSLCRESGLNFCVGIEERNFDPFRIPYSLDDIRDGHAFRGAGHVLRAGVGFSPVRGPNVFASTGGKPLTWGRFAVSLDRLCLFSFAP